MICLVDWDRLPLETLTSCFMYQDSEEPCSTKITEPSNCFLSSPLF